jgi:hypothetical protein
MMTLGIGPTVFVLKETHARMWPVRGDSDVVLQTGQEDAWDADGKKLSSASGSGQDGDLKMGFGLPPAARRFEDQEDGTVRDRVTGLVWLKNADAFGFQTWSHALACCHDLKSGDGDLHDGSRRGDWRLPNIREIESLVDYTGRPPPSLPARPRRCSSSSASGRRSSRTRITASSCGRCGTTRCTRPASTGPTPRNDCFGRR